MVYKGIVKGKVVVLEGDDSPRGHPGGSSAGPGTAAGSPAALLEVWGSDVPDAIWDTVEKAIEALDCTDREHMRQGPMPEGFLFDTVTCSRGRRGVRILRRRIEALLLVSGREDAMAYTDFTLDMLIEQFGLQIQEDSAFLDEFTPAH